VSNRDFNALENVLEDTVPSLRREASHLTRQRNEALQQAESETKVIDDGINGTWRKLKFKN